MTVKLAMTMTVMVRIMRVRIMNVGMTTMKEMRVEIVLCVHSSKLHYPKFNRMSIQNAVGFKSVASIKSVTQMIFNIKL